MTHSKSMCKYYLEVRSLGEYYSSRLLKIWNVNLEEI